MSWQKRSIQLILGFPLALPMVTYAVNIGETYVQSGQNQPLNATINVTDIDPKTFSVQVANPEMYKQLGLSADQQIKAKFVPTSNNGGKIVLTTKSPVSAPFTDVVLNIQNKGEKNLLPKTLLMPLTDKPSTTQKPSTVIETPAESVVVTQNAPIDLPRTTSPSTSVPTEPGLDTPITAVSTRPTTKSTVALPTSGNTTQGNANYTSDGSLGTPNLANLDDSAASTAQPGIAGSRNTTKHSSVNTAGKAEKTSGVTSPIATTTYVVQRNDNLWTIANRIAAKNHTNPKKVMQDIMAANPAVFKDGDAASITANTSINLPKYKVVASRAGVKAAKTLRKQTRSTQHSTNSTQRTTTLHKTRPKATSRRALRRAKYQASTHPVRSSRKAEMTIVAPNQSSGSLQGGNQIQNNHVSSNAAPQLLDQVKQRRQSTAGQASKVNQLSSSIQSSEQKIRLQNEKLAMLEKRLKELNNK